MCGSVGVWECVCRPALLSVRMNECAGVKGLPHSLVELVAPVCVYDSESVLAVHAMVAGQSADGQEVSGQTVRQ